MLSFDDWAVTLASIDAVGGLPVRGKGPRRQILFDVTGVRAERGGSLRVGPAGHRLTPQVPFDRVAIGRVAVVAGAPGNLLLEVDEGRTGQAVLSGKAVFTNILGPGTGRLRGWTSTRGGRRLDRRWRVTPPGQTSPRASRT